MNDIQPTLVLDDCGEVAVLKQSCIEASVQGDRWKGDGVMTLEIRPRPSISIYCEFDEGVSPNSAFPVASDPSLLKAVTFDGQTLNGFGLETNVEPNGSSIVVKWSPNEEPINGLGDDTTKIDKVLFSLFNFDIPGTPYWDSDVDQLSEIHHFEDDWWVIRIKGLMARKEALKEIRVVGGHRMTHVADIRRIDGRSFNGYEAVRILDALEQFLCLVGGLRFELCCPVGFNSSGEQVWSRWSSPRRWNPERLRLFDNKTLSASASLFPGFMNRWQNEDWREGLSEAIYWYEIGNESSRGIDAGIIASQTALERLSFEYCVIDQCLVSREGYRRLRADDRIRLVLSSLGIPLEIPFSAVEMAAARNNNWVDGPHALTQIRNSLVHGGRNRASWSPDCYIETWSLGVWFLEMVILAVCGYEGKYCNRMARRVVDVPWVS